MTILSPPSPVSDGHHGTEKGYRCGCKCDECCGWKAWENARGQVRRALRLTGAEVPSRLDGAKFRLTNETWAADPRSRKS